MRVALEIVSGPHSGRKLVVRSGYVVQVGRTEWADFVLPEDGQLSGVHFAVECSPSECRIRDLKSSSGTRVNGKRVSETLLGEGDQIEAGQSRFIVHVEDAAPPLPSLPSDPTATFRVQGAGCGVQGSGSRTVAPTKDIAPEAELPAPAALAPALPPRELVNPPDREPPRVQGAMRVVLEMIDGPCEKQKVALLPGQVVQVGRTDRADLVFPGDQQMSSRHFAVEFGPDACRLRDLNSTNGTLVNGNRVAETVLADGDKIQAGQTVLVVRIEGGGQQPTGGLPTPAACFRAAMEDEDPMVRREALLAAVWTRQPWVLEHCRKAAAQLSPEHWDATVFLAILGKLQDLPRILAVGRAAELGPQRFEALGAFGHPAAVDVLLEAMASDDAESVSTAQTAYEKITGADLPEPEQARTHWSQFKPTVSQWTRCCRGFDLSKGASEEILAQLDMQSRWEVVCRRQFEGACSISLIDLETLTGFG